MKFSYFEERDKRIREQYRTGKTIEEIAEYFNLMPKTIKQKVRSTGEVYAKDAIIADLHAGLDVAEIASRNNVNIYTVKYIRDKEGIEEKQLAKIVEKHTVRLEPKSKPKPEPKKYSKEWTELQWEEGHRREQLGVIL